jgi:hypothetical protein
MVMVWDADAQNAMAGIDRKMAIPAKRTINSITKKVRNFHFHQVFGCKKHFRQEK